MLDRRGFLRQSAMGGLLAVLPSGVGAALRPISETLRTGAIEVHGNWGLMLHESVHRVLVRMRGACLDGVPLVSDRQPERIRVEEHTFGPPAIWLHETPAQTGWIVVDIGERDWSKLAYQFGHELGHVTANSWKPDALPASPCQWLEEAMVEAFSLRGLARLADGWSRDPPFPGDNAFGAAIAAYRQDVLERYARLADRQGHADDLAAWFRTHRPAIEAQAFLSDFAKVSSLTILAEYDRDPSGLAALGALNRWPGRSALPLDDYLRAWRASCAELGASPALPERLRTLLGV